MARYDCIGLESKESNRVVLTCSPIGSSLHYYETISEPRYEDFEYNYHGGNAFQYLGNGWTNLEVKDKAQGGSEDLAWYLIKPETVLRAPDS